MTDLRPGLRERKRLATRRAIQGAVLSLISERGVDRVTIEEISDLADISPRTFFNYFPSKEAAAVGDAPELPDAAVVTEFVEAPVGSSLIVDLARLLTKSVEAAADDVALQSDRRRILREHPQLFAMRMASMHQFEEQLAEVVARRLAYHDPVLAAQQTELADRARLVTLVAFGALRHAWGAWAESDGTPTLPERITASFAELGRLVEQNQSA